MRKEEERVAILSCFHIVSTIRIIGNSAPWYSKVKALLSVVIKLP